MSDNTISVKTSEVTDALSFFIRLSLMLDVDSAGYIFSTTDKDLKRISIGPKDSEKPAVVYMENLPKADVYVVNPFAEGLSDRSPPMVFFYKLQRASLTMRLSMAIDAILALALEQQTLTAPAKTGKKEKDVPPPPRLPVRIGQILGTKIDGDKTILDQVDEEMVKEFRKFFDQHPDRVIEPVYKPTLQRTEVHVAIIHEQGFIAAIHNMRKKSVAVLQAIIPAIFEDDGTFEQYTSKRIEHAASKLSSWLVTIYRLYQKLNEVIDCLPDPTAPDHLVNLDVYQHHLDRMAAYTNNAKWMIPASSGSTPPTSLTQPRMPGQIPGAVPQLTPMPPTSGAAPVTGDPPPGYKKLPGIRHADGSWGPPQYIVDYGDQSSHVMTPMTGVMGSMMQGMPPVGGMSGGTIPMPGMVPVGSPVWGQPQPMMGGYGYQPIQPMMGMGSHPINPMQVGMQPVGGLGFGGMPMSTGYTTMPGMPPLR